MFQSLFTSNATYLDVLVYIVTRGAASLAILVTSIIALLLIVTVPLQLHRILYAPKDIPWVGQKDNAWFPKLRSTLFALKHERSNLEAGWEKYSSKGKPFVRPSLHWPSVVLPPGDAEWLAKQPESVIAAAKVQDEVLGLEWLASGPSNAFIHDFTVIRRDLTRQINACLPEVMDEIQYAFDTHFCEGQDIEGGWKNVTINDAIRKAVCGVANRVIIGLPVCRSEEYFHAVQKWWVCFGLTGLIFRSFVPKPLQSMIMPVLSLPTWYWRRRIVRMFEPEVARRVKLIQSAKGKANGEPFEPSKNDSRSNDLMQWLIEQAGRSNNLAELSPRNLSNKLVLFNLFATHTLTASFTTLITTLLTHTSSAETLSALRQEAAHIIPTIASSPHLAKQMPLHDSVLRETLRLNPSFDDAMLREVVAPAGVHTPEGVYLPCGSHVAMHTRLMQRSRWSGEGQDWSTFQPFRYCELAIEAQRRVYEPIEENDMMEEKRAVAARGQISAAQISEQYMLFGLGKHAWYVPIHGAQGRLGVQKIPDVLTCLCLA